MKGRNMTRWRDPAKDPRQAPKSNLITAEGAAACARFWIIYHALNARLFQRR
ncbi:hypothetical protein HSBAA_22690 [Vreelandella sulfidaeris]|uniref:Uncharacterized protein n=1 Tax=Vreelandella sulfidaeris TaxID=115553 RepID=A0A455U702_9GAMM|nr:hypothetical protein HSBAA_22690 [Halomonas sulfidaeris]